MNLCECGHLKSYHVTSIEVSLGCSGVIEHRSPAILNHKPCPCLGYRPPAPEPADRAAKCPVCPKCLSDVCDCQFAAAEKCECGHDEKHHHDGTGVWAKGCNQPIAMELGCPCKSYRPPAPEPAESELTDDLYSLPPREFGQKLAEEAIKKLEKLGPPDENPAPVDALEDAKAFADSREDAEGSIGSVYEIMAAFLESRRPEIERKAVERFIITQMRNNQY